MIWDAIEFVLEILGTVLSSSSTNKEPKYIDTEEESHFLAVRIWRKFKKWFFVIFLIIFILIFHLKYSNKMIYGFESPLFEDTIPDVYFINQDSFKSRYYRESHWGPIIHITCLKEVNACSQNRCETKISNDTIYLQIIDESLESCASHSVNQFDYYIYKPNRVNFNVIY